jgi:hypothetical protein
MDDITPYLTIEKYRNWKILPHAIKYHIRIETREIFEHCHHKNSHDEILQLYLYDWLKYAVRTPVWKERLIECNGCIKTLTFANECDYETFYDRYGLEPDEQPVEIAIKTIGRPDTKQITWSEFYHKYNQ